jgi:hypothetical protein
VVIVLPDLFHLLGEKARVSRAEDYHDILPYSKKVVENSLTADSCTAGRSKPVPIKPADPISSVAFPTIYAIVE